MICRNKTQGQDITATAKVNATVGTNQLLMLNQQDHKYKYSTCVYNNCSSGDIGFKVGLTADIMVHNYLCCYGSTFRWLEQLLQKFQLVITLLDTTGSAQQLVISPRVNTSINSTRDIFLQITNTTTASDQGLITCLLLIKYTVNS